MDCPYLIAPSIFSNVYSIHLTFLRCIGDRHVNNVQIIEMIFFCFVLLKRRYLVHRKWRISIYLVVNIVESGVKTPKIRKK
jgi:hypothetical protein